MVVFGVFTLECFHDFPFSSLCILHILSCMLLKSNMMPSCSPLIWTFGSRLT